MEMQEHSKKFKQQQFSFYKTHCCQYRLMVTHLLSTKPQSIPTSNFIITVGISGFAKHYHKKLRYLLKAPMCSTLSWNLLKVESTFLEGTCRTCKWSLQSRWFAFNPPWWWVVQAFQILQSKIVCLHCWTSCQILSSFTVHNIQKIAKTFEGCSTDICDDSSPALSLYSGI